MLYQTCVLQRFPPSLWLVFFNLLTMLLIERKFLILMKCSVINFFSFTDQALDVVSKLPIFSAFY